MHEANKASVVCFAERIIFAATPCLHGRANLALSLRHPIGSCCSSSSLRPAGVRGWVWQHCWRSGHCCNMQLHTSTHLARVPYGKTQVVNQGNRPRQPLLARALWRCMGVVCIWGSKCGALAACLGAVLGVTTRKQCHCVVRCTCQEVCIVWLVCFGVKVGHKCI